MFTFRLTLCIAAMVDILLFRRTIIRLRPHISHLILLLFLFFEDSEIQVADEADLIFAFWGVRRLILRLTQHQVLSDLILNIVDIVAQLGGDELDDFVVDGLDGFAWIMTT